MHVVPVCLGKTRNNRLCERCQAHAKKPTLTRQLSQTSPKRNASRPDVRKLRKKAALEALLFAPPSRHLQHQHDAEAATSLSVNDDNSGPLADSVEGVNVPAKASAAAGIRSARGRTDTAAGEKETEKTDGGRQARARARASTRRTITSVMSGDDEAEEADAEEQSAAINLNSSRCAVDNTVSVA